LTKLDADYAEGGMTLHYGINNGKIVLMVADSTGIRHRISMTVREWSKVITDIPDMGEGDVKAIDNHQQMR